MKTSATSKYLTVEEYLRAEDRASRKHEYFDGLMHAMTGVSDRHNIIALNLGSILRTHLRGSQCRAFIADVRLHIEATNSFYYPDLLVGCKTSEDQGDFSAHPVLVVEILSRSTASIDRREKLHAYRKLHSVREYLIVSQNRQHAELHRKNEDGIWELIEFDQGAEFTLESMSKGPLKISMEQIYEDVDWQRSTPLNVREDTELYGEEADLDW